jgi:hypothetical protein
MLTFIIPLLLGSIIGFLIRGKPSDTFAITTGKRAASAIGVGFIGLLVGLPIGLATSQTTGPQIAGLIGAGLGLGVLNALSLENASYQRWSQRKTLVWLIGSVFVLFSIFIFINSQKPNFTKTADRDDQNLSTTATDPKSLRELLAAAGGGDSSAQLLLGALYGVGATDPPVERNIAESMKWYRRAAEQGVAAAQHNLAELYANGEGVPKNDAEAYFWWNLAAAQGHEKAKTNRDIIEKDMTREQIAEAQRRSAAWKPTKE